MSNVYLASAGAVCHAGRGLTALTEGLCRPVIRPRLWLVEETTPALAVPYLPAVDSGAANRVTGMVEAAVADALEPFPPQQRQGMALFIVSSTGDLTGLEPDYAEALAGGEPALAWPSPSTGLLASRIADKFGITGRQYTINTACSSGVHALLYAAAAIRRGACERALIVGLECPGRVTVAGFNSLLLVTPSQCRPFDRRRDGMILGEAAAAIVLSADRHGPCFTGMRLLGGATACDAANVIQPDAHEVRALIAAALHHAGVQQVDAVKAHGTGTPGNDRAEGAGLAACMDTSRVPVTSLKSALGHTLGACAVLETVGMAACWRAGCFPPTAGFQEPDPAVALTPASQVQALPPGRMLLNYLGFGGNNGALVLEYAP